MIAKNKNEVPALKSKTDKAKQTDAVVKKPKKLKITPWWKEILLGIINTVLIILTFVYLSKLPQQAKLAREQRKLSGIKSQDINLDLAKFELESSKEKTDKLISLFPDQKKLIDFISEIDNLKVTGSVTYFAFASENIVKEKSGFVGYPFVLEFEGTKSQVSDGLEKFNKLPYIFKSINVAIENGEKQGTILLRYGGFLYVQESASKN